MAEHILQNDGKKTSGVVKQTKLILTIVLKQETLPSDYVTRDEYYKLYQEIATKMYKITISKVFYSYIDVFININY